MLFHKAAALLSAIRFLPLLHQGFDEQGDVLNWLDRHADRVQQVFFPTYNLNLYLSPPAIEELMIPQPADFANGLHLRGYQILNTAGDARLTQSLTASQGKMKSQWVLTIKPKEEFTLSLYWLADGPTAVPYTVFIHLVAADGFTRTGQDNQPVWGTYPTTDWQPGEKVVDKYRLAIPEGAPAGDHRLQIGWYDSETQTRVPGIDAHGQPAEDFIILSAVIRVE